MMCSWLSYFGTVALLGFVVSEFLLAFGFVTVCSSLIPDKHRFIYYSFFWIAFEWLLANLPILSFSWLTFSTSFVDVSVIRVFARFGGGALITFLVVFLVAACVVYFRERNSNTHFSNRYWLYVLAGFSVMVIAFSFIAHIQIGSHSQQVTLSVVQGNDKNRYLTPEEINENYLHQSHLALADSIKGTRDIIIFPESAFHSDPRDDEELRERLVPIASKTNKVMIFNTIATEKAGDYNRNYFYSPSMVELGYYDKKRLVPFGEYVPFESVIGSWGLFDEIGSGFQPGNKDLTINGVTSLICYESAFTNDVHRALTDDSRLLVITTNNRSYRRSGNSQQHLAHTQMRAAEYGISAVQASVSGISALIERDGSVRGRTELFEKTNLSGSLSYAKPDSIYSRTGDWLSLCALFVVGYLSLLKLRNYRWRNQTPNV